MIRFRQRAIRTWEQTRVPTQRRMFAEDCQTHEVELNWTTQAIERTDPIITMDTDDNPVTMPAEPSSYYDSGCTGSPSKTQDPVFIVLQHPKSAGNSAMLPMSNILGVFQTQSAAQKLLHSLVDQHRPRVTAYNYESSRRPAFWNTSEPGLEATEFGYSYTAASGEEFSVWIEEHELQPRAEEAGSGEH